MNTKEMPVGANQYRMVAPNQKFSMEDTGDGKRQVRLLAFTGDPVKHWWWGDCIFDRSGCVIENERIPIDYNHDWEDSIGYLDRFSGEKELVCEGFLIPYDKPDDRATEVIYKAERGQPYQCSVMVGEYIEIEEVPKDYTAQVNGMTVAGPITIYRKYTIAGVAICPYGTDPQTSTTLFNKGQNMPQAQTAQTPETKTQENGRELFKRFQKLFGAEKAAKYFSDGLTEEEAKDEFIDESNESLDEKDKQIAELTARVSELESTVADRDAQIAELQTQVTGSGESGEFAKKKVEQLTQENEQLKNAAQNFGGEPTPVSGNQSTPPAKKKWSAVPAELEGLHDKIKNSNAFKTAGLGQ